MRRKHFNILGITVLMLMFGCSPRTFDIILYGNQIYEATDVDEIEIVNTRLKIEKKYFEIGVIKATKETTKSHIKDIAAKKGAHIVIDEGNLNFTLVRYENQKKEESNDKKSIKI